MSLLNSENISLPSNNEEGIFEEVLYSGTHGGAKNPKGLHSEQKAKYLRSEKRT